MFLIYGRKTKASRNPDGRSYTARCSECGNEQMLTEVIGRRYLTFFFVAVIPIGAAHMLECQRCRSLFTIPDAPAIPGAWSTGKIPTAIAAMPGIPIGLIGILMMVMFALPNRDADWARHEGQVTKAGIVEPREKARGANVRVELAYAYQVNGKTYTGTSLETIDRPFWTRADAEAALSGIRAGAPHPVFVNPAKPEEAVLRKSETSPTVQAVLYALALVVIVIGFGLPVAVRRAFSTGGG